MTNEAISYRSDAVLLARRMRRAIVAIAHGRQSNAYLWHLVDQFSFSRSNE